MDGLSSHFTVKINAFPRELNSAKSWQADSSASSAPPSVVRLHKHIREQPRITSSGIASSAPNPRVFDSRRRKMPFVRCPSFSASHESLSENWSCPSCPFGYHSPWFPRGDTMVPPPHNSSFTTPQAVGNTPCFSTVSPSLPQLISPPVFLGTQVQEFRETFCQAVQVDIPSVCQKALSTWVSPPPQAPGTSANETAEQELIYHGIITISGHERAIPRMNYGPIPCPTHPVRQGKQMLPCVGCQPPEQLTFVILINSWLCWNKLLWGARAFY